MFFLSVGMMSLNAQNNTDFPVEAGKSVQQSMDETDGQIAYADQAASEVSSTVESQQTVKVYVVGGIPSADCIKLTVSASPNPTSGNLNLNVSKDAFTTISYQLFDTEGQLLKEEKIGGSQKCIEMNSLEPAIYLVRVIDGNAEIKTFKIVKRAA